MLCSQQVLNFLEMGRGIAAKAGWTFQGTTGIRLGGLPCKGLLFAGALSTTGDFMFDISTGAGVP